MVLSLVDETDQTIEGQALPSGFCSFDYGLKSKQLTHVHPHLFAVLDRYASTAYRRPVDPVFEARFHALRAVLLGTGLPLILDAGCGTGLSTAALAKAHPDHVVLGVDRSLHRLNKAFFFNEDQPVFQPGKPCLIRASLVDLYAFLARYPLPIAKHYMLYPNPYPKPKQLKRRWHGHAIFPQMLSIAPYHVFRSNWWVYLEECRQAALFCRKAMCCASFDRVREAEPLTLFERKYRAMGMPCWQLVLEAAG